MVPQSPRVEEEEKVPKVPSRRSSMTISMGSKKSNIADMGK